jgi:hypothetical protein
MLEMLKSLVTNPLPAGFYVLQVIYYYQTSYGGVTRKLLTLKRIIFVRYYIVVLNNDIRILE